MNYLPAATCFRIRLTLEIDVCFPLAIELPPTFLFLFQDALRQAFEWLLPALNPVGSDDLLRSSIPIFRTDQALPIQPLLHPVQCES
jgi:hypothetical protein